LSTGNHHHKPEGEFREALRAVIKKNLCRTKPFCKVPFLKEQARGCAVEKSLKNPGRGSNFAPLSGSFQQRFPFSTPGPMNHEKKFKGWPR